MRYTSNKCDGCGLELLEDDDIVVCPECATPQHRDCYNKEGQCVNAHLHGTDFVWQGQVSSKKTVKTSTLINEKEAEGEDIICPNCSERNPAGSEKCRNCSMKFTMFGVNIVEAAQQQSGERPADKKPENDIPCYDPPFSVGTGEGFEGTDSDGSDFSSQERPEGTNPWNLGGFNDYEEINIFKGPYPVEDYTATVRTNTLGSFIRNNPHPYIRKFKKSDITGKSTFNWAAFIFSPFWFFYRKLYKPGIIFMTLQLLLSIIITPMLSPFMSFYEYMLTLDLENISDELLYSLMDKMTVLVSEVALPVFLFWAATFLIHLVSGILADKLYKSYCVKNISLGLEQQTTQDKIKVFAKAGGASMLIVLAAYFAQMLLSTLVSYLMY